MLAKQLQYLAGADAAGIVLGARVPIVLTAKIEALTSFVDVQDNWVRPGDDTATLAGLPTNLPGRIIGRSNGVWCVEWNWMPANYLIGIQLDAPKPLEERVDPADTGLHRGLALIGESDVSPMENAHYSHRFGVAVVNRLSAAVIELGTGGSYTVPTGYAH